MRKGPTRAKKQSAHDKDEILPEYDFSQSRPNKYAARYTAGSSVVVLDPDVAAVFTSSGEANDALRALAGMMQRHRPRRDSTYRRKARNMTHPECAWEDITADVLSYRESLRHIWNTYYYPTYTQDPEGTVDFLRASFYEINTALFRRFVLYPIGRKDFRRDNQFDPYPFLRVIPREGTIPLMISDDLKATGGRWQFGEQMIRAEDTELYFIKFFDWRMDAPMDCQYFRVQIASCGQIPSAAGRHGLLDAVYFDRMLAEVDE